MSTSPALVSIGEPLIEFNQPKEGDGRTWLQGFGGDSQNVAIAAARQGASAGYLTSLGQDWMGDAFLELWRAEGVDPSRVRRHPTGPTGVSFVTHTEAGHKFDYLRKNSAASLMTPDERFRVPGHRVKAVDATGAGDTFDGAFLARLLAGDDLRKAAHYANVAAALSTRGYGAVTPIPRAAEVLAEL